MTTGAKAFVDTNVLLRANHPDFGLYHAANALLTQYRQDGYELWISRQIIREYLVQLTRPGLLALPLTPSEVETQVRGLRTLFHVADETDATTDKLIELIKTFPTGGKQIHDANIVATMLVYGIDTLITQNVDDMKRFSGSITLHPLVEESE